MLAGIGGGTRISIRLIVKLFTTKIAISAVVRFRSMGEHLRSTALELVIAEERGKTMNEYLTKLKDFYNTLLVLKELHHMNIITADELRKVEVIIRVKFGIKDNSVFTLNTVAI